MSSGFHGSDFYSSAGIGSRSGINNTVPVQYRPQLGGILVDSSSSPIVPQRNDLLKRSMTEFERQQQQALFNRAVKQRNFQSSPISPLSPGDFSPEISTASSFSPARYGFRQPNPNNANFSDFSFSPFPARAAVLETEPDSDKKMRNQLQELERQLLDDNDDDDGKGNGSSVSAVTTSEWSETIQNLITPSQKPLSPSPTSSSSSSSSSSSLISPKQLLLDSASAISEGKLETATAILARLKSVSNSRGDPEQRLTAYMVSALQSRINPPESSPIAELCSSEHLMATQILYEASPCFKLGFMAAIFTILEATRDQPKIHVVDFDIGQGNHYLPFIQTLAERQSSKPTVKITAVSDPSDPVSRNINNNQLQIVGDRLTKLAERVGLSVRFNVVCRKISDLKRETLGCEADEALAVNFGFRLYKMADESVSTANPRDELLRWVKGLSPRVVTLVEQEMNANTAPFVARFGEASAYYRALIESLDATMDRDGPDRTRVEECLGRKATNAVAREGRERVERCEVFGKWRARMLMAGFEQRPLGPTVTESTRNRLRQCRNNSFTIKEEAGGLCFGWMDRILTVASAWR